jgi:hypothetical protein
LSSTDAATGTPEAHILTCVDDARGKGATSLGWQIAKDNHRAQKLYDRIAANRSAWVDCSLPVE